MRMVQSTECGSIRRSPSELAQEFGDTENLLEALEPLVHAEIYCSAMKRPEDLIRLVDRTGGVFFDANIKDPMERAAVYHALGCRMPYSIIDDEAQAYPEGYDEMVAATLVKKLKNVGSVVDETLGIVRFKYELPQEEEQNG